MTKNYFDKNVADTYDQEPSGRDAETINATVDFLEALAGDGSALEFGVGTGRIALPLSQRGVTVRGIDLSTAMLAVLSGKEGADAIDVKVGDFSEMRHGSPVSLVYLVFNTIMNVISQQGQVRCFQNAAAHLKPGGAFVVEVMVPALQKLPPGEKFVAYEMTDKHWGIDEYDVATQGLISHHARTFGDTTKRNQTPFRYVWPSELDLMARLAGMSLVERWQDWHKSPFTSESESHVSVFRKD